MKSKDQILLEKRYSSIYENLNTKSNRLGFNKFLDGEVKLHSFLFFIPAKNFPKDVLEKYSEWGGFSMEEILNDGVGLDDVSFGADIETDSEMGSISWSNYTLSP